MSPVPRVTISPAPPGRGDSKLSRSSYGIRACLKWRSAASVACRDGVDTRHGALMATPPIPARIGPAEFSTLGAMVAVRCPSDLDHLMQRAGGSW